MSTNTNTKKITPIIDPNTIHNVNVDVIRALDILELDPVQAAKLLQRAINSLHSSTRLARLTQIVSVPDYLFIDPDHRVFTPNYSDLNWVPEN